MLLKRIFFINTLVGMLISTIVFANTNTARTLAMGGVGISNANTSDAPYVNPGLLSLQHGMGINVLGINAYVIGGKNIVSDAQYLSDNMNTLTNFNSDNLDLNFSSGNGGSQALSKLIQNIDSATNSLDTISPIIKRIEQLAGDPIAINANFLVSARLGQFFSYEKTKITMGFFVHNTTGTNVKVEKDLLNQVDNSINQLENSLNALKNAALQLKALNELLNQGSGTPNGTSFTGSFQPISFAQGKYPGQVCMMGICSKYSTDSSGNPQYCINNALLHINSCSPVKTGSNGKPEVCFNGICGEVPLNNNGGGGGNDKKNVDKFCYDENGVTKCVTKNDIDKKIKDNGGTPPPAGDNNDDLIGELANVKSSVDALNEHIKNEPGLEILFSNLSEIGMPFSYPMKIGIGMLGIGITPKIQTLMISDNLVDFAHPQLSISNRKTIFTGNIDAGVAYEISHWIPGTISSAFTISNIIPVTYATDLNSKYYITPVAKIGGGYSIFGMTVESDFELNSHIAPEDSKGVKLGYDHQELGIGFEYDLLQMNFMQFRIGDRYDLATKRNMITGGIGLFPLIHLNISGGVSQGEYSALMSVSVY